MSVGLTWGFRMASSPTLAIVANSGSDLSVVFDGDSVSATAEVRPTPERAKLASVVVGQVGASYEAYDDVTLGGLIAARDPAAIEQLYDRHGAAAYSLARRILGDEQLAQDVVQEVFLAIWRGAATYDGSRGALRTWLFSLTHHKSVDAVRRSQRHSSRRAPEETLDVVADSAPDVADQALAAVQRDEVRAALAGLPEAQRQALIFAYFGGYSQSEIADLVGIPLGTVKTRTLAALRKLRLILEENRLPAGHAEGEPG